MESSSSPMKVHISHTTKKALPKRYNVAERGDIDVKGKGAMKTYWLESCDGRFVLDTVAKILTNKRFFVI